MFMSPEYKLYKNFNQMGGRKILIGYKISFLVSRSVITQMCCGCEKQTVENAGSSVIKSIARFFYDCKSKKNKNNSLYLSFASWALEHL